MDERMLGAARLVTLLAIDLQTHLLDEIQGHLTLSLLAGCPSLVTHAEGLLVYCVPFA